MVMGWDKGRYYTRSRKVNGRVVREYVGTGIVGALAAMHDALDRQERKAQRAVLQAKRAELAALDAEIKALNERIDLVARAALLATGHHQHSNVNGRR
jgi:hypothetical protein